MKPDDSRRRRRAAVLAPAMWFCLADFRGGPGAVAFLLLVIILPVLLAFLICVALPIAGFIYAWHARKTRPARARTVGAISACLLLIGAAILLGIRTQNRCQELNRRFFASSEEAEGAGELRERIRIRPGEFEYQGRRYRFIDGWTEGVRRYENGVVAPRKYYTDAVRIMLVLSCDGGERFAGPAFLLAPGDTASWVESPAYHGPVGSRVTLVVAPNSISAAQGRVVVFIDMMDPDPPREFALLSASGDTILAGTPEFRIEENP